MIPNWFRSVVPFLAVALGHQSGTAFAQAQGCLDRDVNINVVEVSLDGRAREGSGVLLTPEGHVITAAHLLSDVTDLPRLRPSFVIRGLTTTNQR